MFVQRLEEYIVTSSIDSLTRNEKCIFGHYNDMAIVEDNIREVEWGEQADTILVFVRFVTLSGCDHAHLCVVSFIRCIPFDVPHIHTHRATAQQC